MKAAVLHGPRDVTLEEVETPQLMPGDVLLKVKACGICGSDLHAYKHGLFTEGLGAPVESGLVLGHEYSAEVAEINGQPEGFKVGDRVVCMINGGNAEYVKVPSLWLPAILPIPKEVSFEEAATTEPLACALHAVHLANMRGDETVVVLGVGVIGLGVIQALKAVSVPKMIVAVDVSDTRLAAATDVGADTIINARTQDIYQAIFALTGLMPSSLETWLAAGADVVFDCAGASREEDGASSLQQAVMMTKEKGRVVLVSLSERPVEIEANAIMRKSLMVIGSYGSTLEDFAEALDLMARRKVERKRLITHEFPLDQAAEAYEVQVDVDSAIKVLLKP
jgi:2-desacetyl-2-hydroxyethyl bacteriochlorophyllide A dehydrogenase